MKVCFECKKEFDDEKQFCDVCGNELQLKVEEVANDVQKALEEAMNFCVYCGGEIETQGNYCRKCGKSSLEKDKKHCIKCGTELLGDQKFCAKCGTKTSNVVLPKELDEVAGKVKKLDKKKVTIVVIAMCALIVASFIGVKVVPELIVTKEEYLEQANYVEAYNKASADDKDMVLFENLVATICVEAKDGLKDEDSFKLRDIWYAEAENELVLQIQGKNSYGGKMA